MDLLQVDPNYPRLIVAQPSHWTKAHELVQQARGSINDLGKNIHGVEARTRQLVQDLVTTVDQVGSSLPDLVSPLLKWLSPID